MTQPEQPGSKHLRSNLFRALPFFLLFIGIIIATIIGSMVFGPPPKWIGHAVTGVVSLALLALAIVTGAALHGRIKLLHIRHLPLIHKIASTSFSGLAVGTFLLGILIMIGLGEPVLMSSHGLLGLIVAILSTVQLFSSFLVTQRRSIRTVHTIIGYLIVPLFVLQIILGIDAAELFETFGE